MNHQEYQVFYFEFTASGKRHNVAVASTDRKEAMNLILASFNDVIKLREKAHAGKRREG